MPRALWGFGRGVRLGIGWIEPVAPVALAGSTGVREERTSARALRDRLAVRLAAI